MSSLKSYLRSGFTARQAKALPSYIGESWSLYASFAGAARIPLTSGVLYTVKSLLDASIAAGPATNLRTLRGFPGYAAGDFYKTRNADKVFDYQDTDGVLLPKLPGLYELEMTLEVLVGNVTDGNVNILATASGADVTTALSFAPIISSGKVALTGVASGGTNATARTNITVITPKPTAYIRPAYRVQYTGTPSSPPVPTQMVYRMTKVG